MTIIKNFFWNAADQRLRFLWRLIIFALIFGVIVALTQLALQLVAPDLANPGNSTNALAFIQNATISESLTLVGLLIALLITSRWIDRRPFADYGFHFSRAWLLDLLFGLALGAILMTGIFLSEWQLGWVRITSTFQGFSDMPFALSILWPLGLFVAVGIFEELISRGYLIINLAEAFNFEFLSPTVALVLAWTLSSALFGLAHAGNPNASAISTLAITVAGLLLGLGLVLTGDLAIAIGLHITWNFFQGNVFGFPVSGTSTNTASFIKVAQLGPSAWTGGDFGPEAGIIGLIAMAVGVVLLVIWVKWRYGQIRWQLALPRFTPPNQKPTR
jgi:membrane protease YdiL (CAAX protease family)